MTANAQYKGHLVFDDLVHDFGKLSPKQTEVTHTFRYVNKGGGALRILKVRPSCECTASDWTISPVAARDSGMVQLTLDTRELEGKFTKHVTILTDGTPQAVLLKLTGEVATKAKPKQVVNKDPNAPPLDIARSYPKKIGSLLASDGSLFFGSVPKGGASISQLTLYNPTSQSIKINPSESRIPMHVGMQLEKEVIAPKDSIQILFTFYEQKRKDWGYVHSSAFLATDDPKEPRKRIDLSARIVEDFSDWKEGDPRPIAVLDKNKHDFGNLIQHSTVNTNFKITNQGNSPLFIHKTKASCGCTASAPQRKELAPGESTNINVTFRSGNDVGYQKKSITIITNDPKRSEMVIWIDAQVN